MIKLTFEELQDFASTLKYRGVSVAQTMFVLEPLFAGEYEGHVVPKERPRGNNHYTPAKTVKFEKSVLDWFTASAGKYRPPYCPVAINLEIYDKLPNSFDPIVGQMMRERLVFCSVGDVDNKVKAVTDALNGVAFKDDRQVVGITVSRTYRETAGFHLTIFRSGFSRNEAETIAKIMRTLPDE